MTRTRAILAGLLAVFAVSAVASASASAAKPEWLVNSVKLGAGVKREFQQGIELKKNKIVLNGITVKCTGLRFGSGTGVTNAFIEGEKAGSIKELQFTGCAVTSPAECGITNATIKTAEINLKLLENGALREIEFTPKVTEFAKFTFNGETGCGVLANKTVVVKGHTKGSVTPITCANTHTLTIAEKPTTLTATGASIEEFEAEAKIEKGVIETGKTTELCYGSS
ncbi:MAG: hypothetical protein ACYDHN_11510 [Solirubrobacteraceae bacterium]